jgi:exonuclease VII small subunit
LTKTKLVISIFATMNKTSGQTLEEKLQRLKEIQVTLESKAINLSDSMVLLEEAFLLKKDIELEINKMENRLIDLTNYEENKGND